MNDASLRVVDSGSSRKRAVAQMSALTLISRGTGFIRVMVVAAVLGTSYLGNIYQSANMIPNILFELFAAGILQSILVPIMVDAVDGTSKTEAERTASTVLGAILSMLVTIVVAGMVAAPLLIRLLVSSVDDPTVREAQIRLGLFLLWFFLPQVAFYAINLVATAVLNAIGRFGLPVFAPTVNNVVVIGVYLLFGYMRHGQPPDLDLDLAQKLVLGVGTTLGVILFCFVPVLGLVHAGFSLRLRFDFRHPVLRRVARDGLWAGGFFAATQLLLIAVLILSNGVEGGVVVYQLAYVLFLLPHSLFAVPVFTTAFPELTRNVAQGNWTEFAAETGRATRSILVFTFASMAALIALAVPLANLIALGNASSHTTDVARAIVAFSFGLPGFSMLLFLTRAAYSRSDTRTPTFANMVALVSGVVSMVVLTRTLDVGDRVAAIGLGYAVAQVIGAVALALVLRSVLRSKGAPRMDIAGPLLRLTVACGIAAALVRWAVVIVDPVGRLVSTLSVLLGGVVVLVVFVAVQWIFGGPSPALLVRTMGAGTRGNVASEPGVGPDTGSPGVE